MAALSSGGARKGIPTLYRGVLMRSRTEARWAALFDSFGWKWAYEPYELPGYIPDFSLKLGENSYTLVEVKAWDEDFDQAQDKLDATGYDSEALVLGHSIDDGRVVGRIRELTKKPWGVDWVWCEAEFFFCISCGNASVLAVEGSWKCRCCGDGHGNAHVGQLDIDAAFAKATNRVQWRHGA